MRKKAIRSVKLVALLMLFLIIGYSCSDNQDFVETQWSKVEVTVKKGDWKWVEQAGRYEAVVALPELTNFIYESGAQLAYVFIGQQGVDEVQKTLPFVHTYNEVVNGESFRYTETISCDFQIAPSRSVAFYIQASDLGRDDTILADYNFRVVLIW